MDVPGEDRDEERGDEPPDALPLFRQRDESTREHQFDRARGNDDGIFVERRQPRRPIRNDDPVAAPSPRQVRGPRDGEQTGERPARDPA